MAYEVITSGSHRIAARTLIVDGATDQVYLCTTTQTTPRDLTYIKAQADTIGGTFIELTAMIPTTWKGPHIIGQDYKAGDRVGDQCQYPYLHRTCRHGRNPASRGLDSERTGRRRRIRTAAGSQRARQLARPTMGDWYLRTSNGQWYEKASGTWVSRYTDQVGRCGQWHHVRRRGRRSGTPASPRT